MAKRLPLYLAALLCLGAGLFLWFGRRGAPPAEETDEIDFYQASGITQAELAGFLEGMVISSNLHDFPLNITLQNEQGDYLADSRYERHLVRVRRAYADNLARMQAAIARYFPAGTQHHWQAAHWRQMTAAEFQCPDPFRRMVVTWDGRHTMPCCQGFTLEIDGGPVVRVPGYPLFKSIREAWIRDRGMQVFSMVDPSDPMRVVDLFVSHPIPFEELWSRSEEIHLTGTTVRVASIPDLIRMKRQAGRPEDRTDIEHLEAILRGKSGREES